MILDHREIQASEDSLDFRYIRLNNSNDDDDDDNNSKSLFYVLSQLKGQLQTQHRQIYVMSNNTKDVN